MPPEIDSSPLKRQPFGEHAVAANAALWKAGATAFERSMDAKDGSRLKTNEAFGASFWLNLANEVADELVAVLPGATLVEFPRVRYPVILWEGTYFLPTKLLPRKKRRPEELRVRKSDFREGLARLTPQPDPEATLFDLLAGDAEESCAPELGPLQTPLTAENAEFIAYECSPAEGLQLIHLGASASSEGSLLLHSVVTILPPVQAAVPSTTGADQRPTLRTAGSVPPRPIPSLSLRPKESEGEGPQGQE